MAIGHKNPRGFRKNLAVVKLFCTNSDVLTVSLTYFGMKYMAMM